MAPDAAIQSNLWLARLIIEQETNCHEESPEAVSWFSPRNSIRNDVMHFDPDGLEANDLHVLREFAQFLKRLRDVGAV